MNQSAQFHNSAQGHLTRLASEAVDPRPISQSGFSVDEILPPVPVLFIESLLSFLLSVYSSVLLPFNSFLFFSLKLSPGGPPLRLKRLKRLNLLFVLV